MLLVVADTSPIRYLILIGHIELLHALFERVIVPNEVGRELRHSGAPPAVQTWMRNPPDWLIEMESIVGDDPALAILDSGERSAIVLGLALHADLILIDERRGVDVAKGKGLATTGTLGILDLAARRKLIDLRSALELLKQTNFRYRKSILDGLLAQFEGGAT